MLCYKCINCVIRENDDYMFKRFYEMTRASYYLYQINHFQFCKLITFFDENQHTIEKHNKLYFFLFEIVEVCVRFQMIYNDVKITSFKNVDVYVRNARKIMMY